jgi:O-antigen ligase
VMDPRAWHAGTRLGGIANPNPVGLVAMAAGVMLLWDIRGRQDAGRPLYRLLTLLALVACALALYKTSSRTSLASFTAGAAVWMYTNRRGHYVALVMVLAVFSMYVFSYRPEGMVRDFRTNVVRDMNVDILSSRRGIWEQSLEACKKQPWLGYGYGVSAVSMVWDRRASTVGMVRDGAGYLGLLESVGVLGGAALGLVMFLVGRRVWRQAHRPERDQNWGTAMKGGSLFAAMLVHAIGEPWMIAPGAFGHILFWLSIGAVSAAAFAPQAVPQEVRPRDPVAAWKAARSA